MNNFIIPPTCTRAPLSPHPQHLCLFFSMENILTDVMGFLIVVLIALP